MQIDFPQGAMDPQTGSSVVRGGERTYFNVIGVSGELNEGESIEESISGEDEKESAVPNKLRDMSCHRRESLTNIWIDQDPSVGTEEEKTPQEVQHTREFPKTIY